MTQATLLLLFMLQYSSRQKAVIGKKKCVGVCVEGRIKEKQMSEQERGLKRREDFVHRRCQTLTCAAWRKNNNRPVQKKKHNPFPTCSH